MKPTKEHVGRRVNVLTANAPHEAEIYERPATLRAVTPSGKRAIVEYDADTWKSRTHARRRLADVAIERVRLADEKAVS